MDSRDFSSQPPHIHHSHLQHHLGVQQPPTHHGVMMIPHSQTQHYSSGNAYMLPNSNNSVSPTNFNAPMMHQQNPRFPFNPIAATAAAPKPLDHQQFADGSPSGSGAGWLGIDPAKKKRGRPRKYSPDNSIGLALSSAPGSQVSPAPGHLEAGGTPSSDAPAKRSRGRPPGSGKRQLNALGVTGVGFTPHVIMVNSREDIVSRIMAFSQQGPRTVCILSAIGSVSNVSLRQTATSANCVTYEGSFEIISLSGTFPPSENNATQSQNGVLSVSLAGSDGRVFGGVVTGICEAASPVQIIVGSFATESKKPRTPTTSTTPPSHLPNFNIPATGASISSGGSIDSDDNEDSSAIDRGHGSYQTIPSMPMYHHPMGGYSMKMHPSD